MVIAFVQNPNNLLHITMDLSFAIRVFTQLRHSFPCKAYWVQAPHAVQSKRYGTNKIIFRLHADICVSCLLSAPPIGMYRVSYYIHTHKAAHMLCIPYKEEEYWLLQC